MSAKGVLRVKIAGDDSNLQRTLKHSSAAVGGWATGLAKAGAFAGAALAAGVVAGMGSAVKAAADDRKSQVQLAQVLKNTTKATDAQVKATEKWITKQQFATGISDTEYRVALQNLTAATHDVAKSQKLATIVQDIAISRGLSMEAVSLAVAKAQNGNVGALGRLGIATKDAEGKTLDFDTVMKNAAATYKGAAAAAAKADPWKVISERFGEMKEALGERLLPLFDRLSKWVADHMPVIEQVMTTVFDAIGTAAKWVYENVWPPLLAAFNSLRQWVQDHEPELKAVWGRISGAIRALKDFVVEDAWPAIRRAIEAFKKWFFDGGKDAPASMLKDIWDHIKSAFSGMADLLVRNWPNIQRAISDAWKVAGPILGTVIYTFEKIAGAIDWAIRKWNEWDRLINGPKRYAGTNAHPELAGARGGHTPAGGGSNADLMESIMPGFKGKWGVLFAALDGLGLMGGGKATGFGGLAATTERIWNVVKTSFPGAQWMGGYATGGHVKNSDHYTGHAFDVGGSKATMRAIYDLLSLYMGKPIKYLIYDREINYLGNKHRYTGPSPHTDHVHVSTYDQGGWLLPGTTVATNKTGKPERILTQEQMGGVTVNIGTVVTQNAAAFARDLQRELKAYNLRLA